MTSLTRRALLLWLSLALGLAASATSQRTVPVAGLDLAHVVQGWGEPVRDASVEGKPMTIGGRRFAAGLGTHAYSVVRIALDGRAVALRAQVGVDDETAGRGSVRFRVVRDDAVVFDSGVLRGGDPAREVDVPLAGARRLVLLADDADDGIDYDHADWAGAEIEYAGDAPRTVARPDEPFELRTPEPGAAPRLNGPEVYGVRPGRPFLFRIPATGARPMRFSAEGLPESIELDAGRGILRGRAPVEPGEHGVVLGARNDHGEDECLFRIVVGDRIALTPPMGWNSWYIHYHRVTQAHMEAAADAMVESGMADHGYAYVDIDDCWMVKPGSEDPLLGGDPVDADGAVRPNGKFPDMRGLTDHIHALGLKAGIYISPGELTCAGYAGSYGHEQEDAERFAEWGFDLLKYDWCSYGRIAKDRSRAELRKPYERMGGILRELDRDIVLNLCQYGMGQVWEWGAEVGGQSWRTTGDLGLGARDPFQAVLRIGLANARLCEYARPGAWNDPDYLLLGVVGDAFTQGEGRKTAMTAAEQYSTMSLWCLMAAPLIFSGDMAKLDPFTVNVLCNAEVIAVDQDVLGRQGRIVRHEDEALLMQKPMADGSVVVGLFNFAEYDRELGFDLDEVGLSGAQRARDLWRQRDIEDVDGRFAERIGRHDVRLLRMWPRRAED